MKSKPTFADTESGIVLAMYEQANSHYDSYSIAWKLNPSVKVPSPEAEKAFKATRDATENLIERGFVKGERLRGADGVYFKDLKLTPEGERAAIAHRKEVERLKEEMPRIIERANAVAQEMAEHEKKQRS